MNASTAVEKGNANYFIKLKFFYFSNSSRSITTTKRWIRSEIQKLQCRVQEKGRAHSRAKKVDRRAQQEYKVNAGEDTHAWEEARDWGGDARTTN